MNIDQNVIKRSKPFKLGFCACGCEEEIQIRDKTGIFRRFKKGHQNRGPNHPLWNGGVTYDGKGYKLVKSPNHPHKNQRGYVYEHRLVMEEHMGRYLRKDEEINHINKDIKDNRIQNLEILSKSTHATKHMIGNKRGIHDMSGRCCVDCRTENTHVDKYNNRPHWYHKGDGFQCVKCNRKEKRSKKP